MPYYQIRGQVPHKRHTVFRQPNGTLFHEELVSTEGFSSVYSLVYHHFPPTRILRIDEPASVMPEIAVEKNLRPRSILGFRVPPEDDFLKSRKPLLVNNDVFIEVAAPRNSMSYFYKNGDADEVIFIHIGSGVLKTAFGEIRFGYGDYLHIPRGVIYQLHFDSTDNRLLIIQSFSPVEFPKRYQNKYGQLLEHSPFCERDIRPPQNLQTFNEEGEFLIYIQKQKLLYPFYYANHPFDYIGWDGYFYPYAFSIHDFEPITGRVHQPPPVHQTFEAHNFVICSFVPRLYDYHPEAIPAPYHHSNIDSEEVLYYVD
ncbi:MAG: homogentisate 1,2-dioxygenase, partial [Bacteroidia bacterium]|nr:homogentisate 1,2-dioxygenase [Bacteroidia bacterium]